MLVNIYGSRDLFVSEYRTLLADRILSSFNYDIAKEVSDQGRAALTDYEAWGREI